jgi:hypothetical protein
MKPAPLSSLVFLLLTIGLCVSLVAIPTACSGNKRQDTLRATVIGVNAARDGFTNWDAAHQKTIVEKATSREEGEAQLVAYREKRAPIVATFEVVYRAIALAATQTDDPSLRSAVAAGAALLEAIQTLTGGK